MKTLLLLACLISFNSWAASLNFSVTPEFTGSKTAVSFDNRSELPSAIQQFSSKRLIAAKVAFTIPKSLDRLDASILSNPTKIQKLFGLASIQYVNPHLSHATKAAPLGLMISLDIQNYLINPGVDNNPFENITEKIINIDTQLAGTEDLLVVQKASNFNMLLGTGYNICKLYQRSNDILVVAYSFLEVTSDKPTILIGGALKSQLESEISSLKAQIPVLLFK